MSVTVFYTEDEPTFEHQQGRNRLPKTSTYNWWPLVPLPSGFKFSLTDFLGAKGGVRSTKSTSVGHLDLNTSDIENQLNNEYRSLDIYRHR